MKKNIFLLIALVFIVTGCSFSQPDVPKYTIGKKDKVGFIVDIRNKNIEHTHIGTTVFNNFEKSYYTDWKIKEQTTKLIENKLNAQVIDLSKHNIQGLAVDQLIVASSNKWQVNKPGVYHQLANDLGLKAVIVVKDKPTSVYEYPSHIPIKGSGLISRSFLGLDKFYAVLGLDADIYLLNPVGKIHVNAANAKLLYLSLINSLQEKSGFIPPQKIDSITIKEFEPVKKANTQLLDNFIYQLNKHIR